MSANIDLLAIDKQKTELLTKVSELVKVKRSLYGKIDISRPKCENEKSLDAEITNIYSQINQIVKLKRLCN